MVMDFVAGGELFSQLRKSQVSLLRDLLLSSSASPTLSPNSTPPRSLSPSTTSTHSTSSTATSSRRTCCLEPMDTSR
jgi:phosphatidate phosphatase PAH1